MIPYSRLVGFELVDLDYGQAVLKLKLREELLHPYGALHGEKTASLIDTAMAFSCFSCVEEGEQVITINGIVFFDQTAAARQLKKSDNK